MHSSRGDHLPAVFATAIRPSQPCEATARGPLTRAQREVLRASAAGLTSTEVGERLGMDPQVVRAHLVEIISKLGARSKLEAVVMAIRAGWIEPTA